VVEHTVTALRPSAIRVTNAAIALDRPFIDSTDDDWARAIENNLHGFFNVARAVLPHMIARKKGPIIATGSCITEVADFGGNYYSVCTASKHPITTLLPPIPADHPP